ncbi:MAG: hypothetical protein ACLSG5_18085 [Oscillospiraceae bacterium]
MNQSFDRSHYWGEDFGAVKQPFVSGCDMWLILPTRTNPSAMC